MAHLADFLIRARHGNGTQQGLLRWCAHRALQSPGRHQNSAVSTSATLRYRSCACSSSSRIGRAPRCPTGTGIRSRRWRHALAVLDGAWRVPS